MLLLHILYYHVLACIALWIYLFEHSDEQRNCWKNSSLEFLRSIFLTLSLSTAKRQHWTPQMKLYHQVTDCQRIPSVSCPSCSTSSGIFMGICASWECGSQKEMLIQSSTTSSALQKNTATMRNYAIFLRILVAIPRYSLNSMPVQRASLTGFPEPWNCL